MDKMKDTGNFTSRPGGAYRRCPSRLVAILLGLLLVIARSEGVQAQGEPDAAIQVQVEAPTHVAPGELIRLHLRLQTPAPLAGFEVEVRYAPTAAEFAGFTPHLPQAHSLARLSLPDQPFGAVVGAYACATAPCLAHSQNDEDTGLDDTVFVAVELLPLQAGALEIGLDHLRLVDSTGQPLPVHLSQSTLTVQVGEETTALAAPASLRQAAAPLQAQAEISAASADVTQDGRLSHADVMEVALAWQVSREAGTACVLDSPQVPEPQVDINRDGCVDVADVQLAATLAAENTPIDAAATDGAADAAVPSASTAVTLTVNSTGDAVDAQVGDAARRGKGVCHRGRCGSGYRDGHRAGRRGIDLRGELHAGRIQRDLGQGDL